MAKRKTNREQLGRNDEGASIEETIRALVGRLEIDPWLQRATEMLQARPGVTIGAAVGTGFVLGLTLFSKIGRIALIGALGIGTELLVHKARTSFREQLRPA